MRSSNDLPPFGVRPMFNVPSSLSIFNWSKWYSIYACRIALLDVIYIGLQLGQAIIQQLSFFQKPLNLENKLLIAVIIHLCSLLNTLYGGKKDTYWKLHFYRSGGNGTIGEYGKWEASWPNCGAGAVNPPVLYILERDLMTPAVPI